MTLSPAPPSRDPPAADDSSPAPPIRLRQTLDRRRAEAFALGLDAANIDSDLERHGPEWWLVVRAADGPAAEAALLGYDAEVDQLAVVALPVAPEANSWLGVWVGLGLLAIYAASGPVDGDSLWFRRGAALSGPILAGAWWRPVTALGLHAHFAHVLGNSAMGFVLLGALGAALGPGVAGLAALATGIGGNWLTALWHGPGHASIGASTAIFGALGLLTAPGQWRRSRWPAWVTLGGSLALLGFLGTDDHADLAAHLSGWGLGLGLGWALGPLHAWRRLRALQLGAGAAALATIAAAVWRAAVG